MDIEKLTIDEYVEAIKAKKLTAASGIKHFLNKIASDKHNAVIESFPDAIDRAKEIDNAISAKGGLNVNTSGKMLGVPVIIKDNILYKGHKSSAASKMLANFVSPYSATIVEKMLAEGAIIIGRANMDEFAMGTTGETSTYGGAKNAIDPKYVAGGSSSGSASAVGSGLCLAAIGTDTGGSIRCPAAWNGLYGLKPTYGTVSRYGIIAFASSLDQAGPLTRNLRDAELVHNVIKGKDIHDARTTINFPKTAPSAPDKLNIGYIKEVWDNAKDIQCFDRYQKLFSDLKAAGHTVTPISIKNFPLALATYYIIAPAEVASNLARFDGVRYTSAPKDPDDLDQLYVETRTKFFGNEVKRRINLGNYVLSSGFFDAYYNKAKAIQHALTGEFIDAFKSCDCVITPTTPAPAPELGAKVTSPVQMYLIDLFTIVANITGLPALAVPFGVGANNLPLGAQIMGAPHSEPLLFSVAEIVEQLTNCTKNTAPTAVAATTKKAVK